MRLQVLGSAGGIGGCEKFTTSFMLDDDILLDAGTGATTLPLDRLAKIDHVFLTHTHIDHIVGLALLLDSILGRRKTPVTVHATPTVIKHLKKHVFNWIIWPDFSAIPSADKPILQWAPMKPGTTVEIKERLITSHGVNHTVNAVAYWVRNATDGFLFTGDLGETPTLWKHFHNKEKINKIIVDCSFPNAEATLATQSKHYCPQSLQKDVETMPTHSNFLVYHLKPGAEELIMHELNTHSKHHFQSLHSGDIYDF